MRPYMLTKPRHSPRRSRHGQAQPCHGWWDQQFDCRCPCCSRVKTLILAQWVTGTARSAWCGDSCWIQTDRNAAVARMSQRAKNEWADQAQEWEERHGRHHEEQQGSSRYPSRYKDEFELGTRGWDATDIIKRLITGKVGSRPPTADSTARPVSGSKRPSGTLEWLQLGSQHTRKQQQQQHLRNAMTVKMKLMTMKMRS